MRKTGTTATAIWPFKTSSKARVIAGGNAHGVGAVAAGVAGGVVVVAAGGVMPGIPLDG
jgi:hypothetical protein